MYECVYRKPLLKNAEVRIQLDDPTIIETIGSFTITANSTKAIFIPIHGKGIAGHCVMSFTSKVEILGQLYLL